MAKLPKKHTDCSACILGGKVDWDIQEPPPEPGLCKLHKGPDGEPIEYEGEGAYEPVEWVTYAVGSRYTGYDYKEMAVRVWLCIGYDPRHGVWLRNTEDGLPPRLKNISERAIDKTFHKVRLTGGAWNLLGLMGELKRLPTEDEAKGQCTLDLAQKTLISLGFLSRSGSITSEGQSQLASGCDWVV